MNLAQTALGLRDYIQSWRRRLHQYPELSLQEVQTTQALAEELDRLGIPVIRFPGHTGLIGVIAGSFPGKTVLLRADIDALPIRENTGLPYAAQNGRHACLRPRLPCRHAAGSGKTSAGAPGRTARYGPTAVPSRRGNLPWSGIFHLPRLPGWGGCRFRHTYLERLDRPSHQRGSGSPHGCLR